MTREKLLLLAEWVDNLETFAIETHEVVVELAAGADMPGLRASLSAQLDAVAGAQGKASAALRRWADELDEVAPARRDLPA